MARSESPAERRARRAEIDDPAVVLNAAARYLEARARSIAEVRRHLVGAGYAAALVDGAIARLVQLGYLDDAAFARSWIASRDRSRPRGERALRMELGRKGLDDGTIRAALADRHEVSPAGGERGEPGPAGEPPADERAAERLLEKKAAALRREADPRVRRQKAYGLLARNGFDPGIAARLSERFVRASAADGPEDADDAFGDDGPPGED